MFDEVVWDKKWEWQENKYLWIYQNLLSTLPIIDSRSAATKDLLAHLGDHYHGFAGGIKQHTEMMFYVKQWVLKGDFSGYR